MKHFVRIMIVILVLSLIGGAVWFFCFRTKPNDVVFKELTESDTLLNDDIFVKTADDEVAKGYDEIVNVLLNKVSMNLKEEKTVDNKTVIEYKKTNYYTTFGVRNEYSYIFDLLEEPSGINKANYFSLYEKLQLKNILFIINAYIENYTISLFDCPEYGMAKSNFTYTQEDIVNTINSSFTFKNDPVLNYTESPQNRAAVIKKLIYDLADLLVKDAKIIELNNILLNINELYKFNVTSKESFDYYYTLAASADDVSRSSRKSISKTIKNYNNAIKDFANSAQELFNMYKIQKIDNVKISDTGYSQIVESAILVYETMALKLKIENELYFELREYANEFVFKNQMVDYRSAYYDVYNIGLKNLCNDLVSKSFDITSNKELIEGIYSTEQFDTMNRYYAKFDKLKDDKFINEESNIFLSSYRNLKIEEAIKLLSLDLTDANSFANLDFSDSNPNFFDQTLYNSIKLKIDNNENLELINTTGLFTEAEKAEFNKHAKNDLNENYTLQDIKSIFNGTYRNEAVNKDKELMQKLLKDYFNKSEEDYNVPANIETKSMYMERMSKKYNISIENLLYSQEILKYVLSYK